jgi:hypothetical protein
VVRVPGITWSRCSFWEHLAGAPGRPRGPRRAKQTSRRGRGNPRGGRWGYGCGVDPAPGALVKQIPRPPRGGEAVTVRLPVFVVNRERGGGGLRRRGHLLLGRASRRSSPILTSPRNRCRERRAFDCSGKRGSCELMRGNDMPRA